MKPRTPLKTVAYAMEDDKDKGDRNLLGLRKKGISVRTWLTISIDGGVQMVEAGKHAIMRRAGLPGRDLRILDPMLSYPSTILGRERAIVLNLEHIKAIITAQEVLLLNSKDPAVAPFVADLQQRLPPHSDIQEQQRSLDGGSEPSDNEENVLKAGPAFSIHGQEADVSQLRANGFLHDNHSPAHRGPNALPFEFRALEACLEAACSCLDAEATILDKETYPALDLLTSHISTLNLERVRQIKSRLVAISGRVQKVRDEIEKLLDDDGDMAEMYLTDKLMRQQLDGPLSPASTDGGYDPVSVVVTDGIRTPTPHYTNVSTVNSNTVPLHDLDHEAESGGEEEEPSPTGSPVNMLLKAESKSSSTSSSSSSSSSDDSKNVDVEELEMLLEAYFVQIDGTSNKLSALREYVEDTEDYINIMLDDKQNHLLQMGVMLTTATLVLSLSIVVTGIFGMNIHIEWFEDTNYRRFSWVVGGSVIASLLMYVVVIGWCKWKHLLE